MKTGLQVVLSVLVLTWLCVSCIDTPYPELIVLLALAAYGLGWFDAATRSRQ